jgi:hypothetical protein
VSSELTNQQKCLCVRNGVEIWLDADKAEKINKAIAGSQGRSMIDIEGRTINLADLVGMFLPEDMEGMTRRKNGQWKCRVGKWHDRGEKCFCLTEQEIEEKRKRDSAYHDQHGFYPLQAIL